MNTGYVSEIYPTIQGEGPWTGQKQLFVRLAGCPLRCDYCDTPDSLSVNGHRKMTSDELFFEIQTLSQKEQIDTISVTGGEPLIQAPFLREVLRRLKEKNIKIHLETAGVHHKSLKEIVDFCDVVAMDIKLPSATGQVTWSDHEAFIKAAKNKAFVKIVIEEHSLFEEIEKAISLLVKFKPPPLLIFQPVTPVSAKTLKPKTEKIQEIVRYAREKLPVVRVMPQQHKIWGYR